MTVVEGKPDSVKDIVSFTGGSKAAVYTISGVRVDKPTQHGIYIVNGKKIVKQ